MDILNTLLTKCVKREELSSWLPRPAMPTMEKQNLEKAWRSNDFRRMIYKNYCESCTCKYDCKIISYRHWMNKNVIINYFGSDESAETEIIFYKEDLKCIDEQRNVEFDGGSNYINIDGCLYPKDENLRNIKFLENMANSARQSLDKYWGYALSNEWDYFVTLTTDKKIVGDRYDDELIKSLWRNCRKRLQRFDKDVKILLTPERHKDGALHFHGFVSMKRPFLLKEYIDPNTHKLKFSKVKTPLFEFPFWVNGLASCAVIQMDKFDEKNKKGESEEEFLKSKKRRLTAYLSKYVVKANGVPCGDVKKSSEAIGYKQKRFYHTKNLIQKTKEILYLDRTTIENITADYEIYKETDTYIIYREKSGKEK